MSWHNAYQYSVDIKKCMVEEGDDPNATVRKAGKVKLSQVFSNDSTASTRSRQMNTGHGATNGFASSFSRQHEGMAVAWET